MNMASYRKMQSEPKPTQLWLLAELNWQVEMLQYFESERFNLP